MKIYIKEKTPFLAKNNTKILNKLEKFLVDTYDIVDVYSKEGIYQIHDNKMFKLNVQSEKIKENIIMKTENNKSIELLIDDSVVQKENVSHIPFDHIHLPLSINSYSLHKNNKMDLVLVIEFIKNYKPINYYFEYKSSISNNNLPMEDINVFLSLLN